MKKILVVLLFAVSLLFGKVDINSASQKELMSLTGIGQKTAERIISYRDKNCFSSVAEIKKIKGIGEGKYSKLKEKIEVKPCKK